MKPHLKNGIKEEVLGCCKKRPTFAIFLSDRYQSAQWLRIDSIGKVGLSCCTVSSV